MKLSILMPVYNEAKTIEKIIGKVENVNLGAISKELIIVDDSSTDSTQKIISNLKKKYRNIRAFRHSKNKGKGAAIRTGIKYASGEIVVIQDGDLEYNPEDFKRLIKPILQKKAKVVYGSRFLGKTSGFSIPSHYYGNIFLTFLTRILYNRKVTDMETCYKMMTSDIIKKLNLQSDSFAIEPEITAKILRKGHRVIEIPINYRCRSFAEGKKIGWKDGIIAVYTLLKYRFLS